MCVYSFTLHILCILHIFIANVTDIDNMVMIYLYVYIWIYYVYYVRIFHILLLIQPMLPRGQGLISHLLRLNKFRLLQFAIFDTGEKYPTPYSFLYVMIMKFVIFNICIMYETSYMISFRRFSCSSYTFCKQISYLLLSFQHNRTFILCFQFLRKFIHFCEKTLVFTSLPSR